MIEDAFTYPTENENWVQTVVIGGILTVLGVLIVPMFAVQGYVLRVIRATIAGESEPPVFEDWGDLFVEGFQAWLIGIIYMLVPIIVAFLTVGGAVLAMASGSESGAAIGIAGMFGGIAISGILALLFGYFAVAAIVVFAQERQFGAAFDFAQIRTLAFNTDYAFAWLVSIGGFIAAAIVSGIPIVGYILGPFASFYAFTVAGRLWAGGYLDAVGTETDTSPDVGEGEEPSAA